MNEGSQREGNAKASSGCIKMVVLTLIALSIAFAVGYLLERSLGL